MQEVLRGGGGLYTCNLACGIGPGADRLDPAHSDFCGPCAKQKKKGKHAQFEHSQQWEDLLRRGALLKQWAASKTESFAPLRRSMLAVV